MCNYLTVFCEVANACWSLAGLLTQLHCFSWKFWKSWSRYTNSRSGHSLEMWTVCGVFALIRDRIIWHKHRCNVVIVILCVKLFIVVEFLTTRTELNAVFDIFDRHRTGEINYGEFMNALRPERQVACFSVSCELACMLVQQTSKCHEYRLSKDWI